LDGAQARGAHLVAAAADPVGAGGMEHGVTCSARGE
jgi:hypothetical protein